MGQKNTFFEEQSGEVAENKQKRPKNKPEQTGKQSGEVVENTCLLKKQTGTNRKTKLPILLKIQASEKSARNKAEKNVCLRVARSNPPMRPLEAPAGSPLQLVARPVV